MCRRWAAVPCAGTQPAPSAVLAYMGLLLATTLLPAAPATTAAHRGKWYSLPKTGLRPAAHKRAARCAVHSYAQRAYFTRCMCSTLFKAEGRRHSAGGSGRGMLRQGHVRQQHGLVRQGQVHQPQAHVSHMSGGGCVVGAQQQTASRAHVPGSSSQQQERQLPVLTGLCHTLHAVELLLDVWRNGLNLSAQLLLNLVPAHGRAAGRAGRSRLVRG